MSDTLGDFFLNADQKDSLFMDSLIKKQKTKELENIRSDLLKDFTMEIEWKEDEKKLKKYKFSRKDYYGKR